MSNMKKTLLVLIAFALFMGTASAQLTVPKEFLVKAFSVNEGKADQSSYWLALEKGNSRAVLLSVAKLVNGANWMEVQRVDLDNNTVAFKVLNAGADMYLVARDNKEVHVENVPGGKVSDAAKFRTITALTSAKGSNDYRSFESVKFSKHFLRHQGLKLFVHTNNNTELFKQDASWFIEKDLKPKEVFTQLPDKFKVHAFSVNEGKLEKDDYWFALTKNSTRGEILSATRLVDGAKWMEIQRVNLENNTVAFKVLNAGADMYLVARDNKEVYVDKFAGGKVTDAAKFRTVAPLTTAKGSQERNYRSFESVKFSKHYLRHSGYVLYVNTNNNTELFKQDASWLIQKM